MLHLTAIVQKESGMFIASCPETGTVSQEKTVSDTVANLKEATELCLEEFPTKTAHDPLLKNLGS